VYSKSRVKNFSFLKDFEIWLFSHWDFLQILKFWMLFNALGFFKSKKQTKFGFFLSEKLDPENAYELHIDIHYKSLLF